MDAKHAALLAKQYLVELLEDEKPSEIGLEEIERVGDTWQVTLGFSRPWDRTAASVFAPPGASGAKRTFRIFQLRDDTGEVVSMRLREGT